ncbi:hypothetical protein RFI_07083 [Reticulomyxa filosa]|uniref:Uncharacterized protein n=1 Tax=Reticulomyxa filosa TaxID=46433 RepID=X6NVX2_RETFI|nr:hypothetical protein RFI_07083 [Reticulomyxa filosa]|eukprot:ETO30038.1 hypothetical protein RFI_07083 [Reticulomyxa filosa]
MDEQILYNDTYWCYVVEYLPCYEAVSMSSRLSKYHGNVILQSKSKAWLVKLFQRDEGTKILSKQDNETLNNFKNVLEADPNQVFLLSRLWHSLYPLSTNSNSNKSQLDRLDEVFKHPFTSQPGYHHMRLFCCNYLNQFVEEFLEVKQNVFENDNMFALPTSIKNWETEMAEFHNKVEWIAKEGATPERLTEMSNFHDYYTLKLEEMKYKIALLQLQCLKFKDCFQIFFDREDAFYVIKRELTKMKDLIDQETKQDSS